MPSSSTPSVVTHNSTKPPDANPNATLPNVCFHPVSHFAPYRDLPSPAISFPVPSSIPNTSFVTLTADSTTSFIQISAARACHTLETCIANIGFLPFQNLGFCLIRCSKRVMSVSVPYFVYSIARLTHVSFFIYRDGRIRRELQASRTLLRN